MNASGNTKATEMHGCIVCGRIFNLLTVYAPDGHLVGCVVTSPGGRPVLDERRPLAACDTHSAGEIEAAYKRWQARQDGRSDQEEEGE